MAQTFSSERKKKHSLFCHNFKNYIRSFMGDYRLIDPTKKIAISVSGGVDSMALADVLSSLGVSFELIHFNHGTRPLENKKEEDMVLAFAKKIGVKVNIFHFDCDLNTKNFEKHARDLRQKIYKQFLADNFWIYTAHHIDDSFEWSLMQSFKQSDVRATLGIPVFNNGLVRPFLCVTKKQILRYARAKKLEWLEDTSNHNTKFERNFLRKHVTNAIHNRYPNSLSHYVARSNEMALLQKVHRNQENSKVFTRQEKSGGVIFISENLREHKKEIKEAIYKFSNKERGEIDHELDKVFSAHEDILKNPASFPYKGPMNFSGGVSLYLMRDHLFICNQTQWNFYQSFDLKLKNYLEKMPQIPERAMILEFPELLISFRNSLSKSSKFIHPLLPVTCLWLKNSGISYAFSPVLSIKHRQLLANDAVILDSSLLGL